MSVQTAARKFKLGLIVNPYAGIGGALALKGSDGAQIREQALAAGAQQQAPDKTALALQVCLPFKNQMCIYTGQAELGGNIARKLGFELNICYRNKSPQTEAQDTIALASALLDEGVDLLLFAGGDGTARNLISVVADACPVLGVPAGCKIHSGVYAITPSAAGEVLTQVLRRELVSLMSAEVKDLDEDAFRRGQVVPKFYGSMLVPQALSYIQAVKMGGKESDELVLDDIAAHIEEVMDDHPDTYFVMGSGSTIDAVMTYLAIPNSLLGVDIVLNRKLLASDVNAAEIMAITADKPCRLIITLIGGQGHILGRGNQQLSPAFINKIGKSNIMLVATKAKLQGLQQKPLIVDSGDIELDRRLSGPIAVITGFHDQVLYSIG